jgi:hypothetical protein
MGPHPHTPWDPTPEHTGMARQTLTQCMLSTACRARFSLARVLSVCGTGMLATTSEEPPPLEAVRTATAHTHGTPPHTPWDPTPWDPTLRRPCARPRLTSRTHSPRHPCPLLTVALCALQVRCVPRRWCEKQPTPARLLWRDDGQGGRPGSFWAIPTMELVAAAQGAEPPEEVPGA